MSDFIGRGEVIASKILFRLVDCVGLQGQVNIQNIILPEDYAILDQEVKNHNFDFIMRRTSKPDVVIEINYKHKEKAAKKWSKIFIPLIEKAGYDYMTIDDYDCRKRGLFWLNSKGKHLAITWDDYRDVIDSLETAGINPSLVIFEE